ncbi:hypothetical protein A5634_11580 [Mycobacterium asiaticum]|uniref:Integral membrane bound transporter domain-containing protein n=1 Tax=Mycobacterium asiaticum TaxID=1790 RepID=A0A1A3NHM5_MYCAS|nr:FUSC family protein [Mycobacterium asiaticum]OBK20820.1 hypothetical protein A5634_11580 [Mycobacterium asiaticum]
MSTLLRNRLADGGHAATHRLRAALWPIVQTSVAAGTAWYLTHDVLHHPQPFFAPIAAVVCMSASNVLRARRAGQMIVGVTLGIVLGAGVQELLGTGGVAFGVAVFVALGVAVLIGTGFIAQGLMFVNQTAVSATLVLAFAHSAGMVGERLFDALVGGGLAFAFSILLFPANPVKVLLTARAGVLRALHDTLEEIEQVLSDPQRAAPEWPLACVDRLHNQLGALTEARSTARLIVRRAPLRLTMRPRIDSVDQQAARLGLLASAVLQLARSIIPPVDEGQVEPLRAAVADLVQATSAADLSTEEACGHTAAAREHAADLESGARTRRDALLADIVRSCIDDLQAVIDCPRH